MKKKLAGNPSPEIPKQVFQLFLDELEKKGVSTDVVKGLQQALLEEESLTESAIRRAIFPETQHP